MRCYSIANADYPIWSVQLQMTYPLGRSVDRAAYERARLELQQNRVQIRRIELRIGVLQSQGVCVRPKALGWLPCCWLALHAGRPVRPYRGYRGGIR